MVLYLSIGGFIFLAFIAIAVLLVCWSTPQPAAPTLLSITDTISLWFGLLAVLVGLATLVLTGVAVAIAILAIFGWQKLHDSLAESVRVTKETSEAISREVAAKYLEGDDFKKDVQGRLGDMISWDSGTVKPAAAHDPNASETEELAKGYPKDGGAE